MSFRHTIRALGLGARPLLNFSSSTPAAAPRFLNVAFYNTRLQSTRLASSSSSSSSSPSLPNLSPPWKLRDLSKVEKEAYEKYGTNYLEHLTTRQQTEARNAHRRREKCAKLREAELGPQWYEIIKAADARFYAEFEEPIVAEFQRRAALLGPVVDPRKPPLEHRHLRDDKAAWRLHRTEKRKELQMEIKEKFDKRSS
ncbi:unnamed protein product [Discula destructiva]